MAAVTYTVVKGDTLTKIAKQFNTTVDALVKLNNIRNPDYIVVGQVLTISGGSSGGGSSSTNTPLSKATISLFGLQSDTDRTLYVTWEWSASHTDCYQVIWYYDSGDKVWFIGNDSTTSDKQSLYTAPANANRVKFKVKPISKKYKASNGNEVNYWTAGWSTERMYHFAEDPPEKPSTPSVEIKDLRLTAEVDNVDPKATIIEFEVIKDDKTRIQRAKMDVKTSHASFSCSVNAGSEYKVRCRALSVYKMADGSIKTKIPYSYSEWSEYSNNVGTPPAAPSGIKSYKANSETSVYLEWGASKTAETYEIEYAVKKEYFDGSDQTSKVSGIEFTHYEKGGLETGEEYFFRVRAVNSNGNSPWTKIVSVTIGKKPAPPTTWSSTTTAITGEPLILYWVHNSEDGSSQTYADLELYIDGVKETHTIKNTEDEEEKDKTSSYEIDTSGYTEGSTIQWRVRTAGVTKQYGDWSTQRIVNIYAPPTLELKVTDVDGNVLNALEQFPFYVSALAGPNTQMPIGYNLTITANESYETVDAIGNIKMVKVGDQVYSKYFDTNDVLLVEFTPGNIDLENNISYTLTCIVAMNSGLTTSSSSDFTVSWSEISYEPNAEIGADLDNLSVSIRPYCVDAEGNTITGVSLSVYRREYDGTFTEIASGLDNTKNTFVTDPHPSLDYARYRVVAVTDATGAVGYYDVPAYYIGETSIVIQWDEDWSTFDAMGDSLLAEPTWCGSMLKLPYNVDVTPKYNKDVTLVEYAGRKHPVSYYGTHLGEAGSWKAAIDKNDIETLYTLRRLAIWMGNVYVREPSGTGYWANISVSFGQTHKNLTIPVTIDISRVEGGV